MDEPISIPVGDDVRSEMEAQAQARGSDVVTGADRDAQRARIRMASEAIGRRVASDPDARALYDEIGSPTTDSGL